MANSSQVANAMDGSRSPEDEGMSTALLLSFARELEDVVVQLDQGVSPDRYKRLSAYRDALCVAQNVVVAFQQKRSSDGNGNF